MFDFWSACLPDHSHKARGLKKQHTATIPCHNNKLTYGMYISGSDKCLPSAFVTILWKTIHLGTQRICGNAQLKFSAIFLKLTFLHILIKQLLSLLVVKFHTHSFFILGDILNYCISDHVVDSQCVGQQLTYKLGDLFITKTKQFLVFRQ